MNLAKLSVVLLSFVACIALADSPSTTPGSLGGGTVLLPNGWRIAPVGRHLPLDDLPMEMVESPDGHYLIVTNNGYSKPILSVVDLDRLYVLDRVPVDNAWLGLAWNPGGTKLYSSQGGAGSIQVLTFAHGLLKPESMIQLKKPVKQSFVGGLSVSPDGKRIYAVQVLGNVLNAIDSDKKMVVQTANLEAEPYTTLLSQDGKSLYVSLWGGSKVVEFDAGSLKLRRSVATGEHPNSMALSPDGSRLYVACANTNSVWVINVKTGAALEQVSVSLFPKAPAGSTPTGVGLSPDGKTLLVANSDNNCVAVIDVSTPGTSHVRGFIPSGWYPTAAHFSRDGKRILVLSGKGLTSVPNPHGAEEPSYIAEMLLGTISILDVPNDQQLAEYSKTVYSLTPYSDATRIAPANAPSDSPIPAKIGDASPIKHVFYIIRENRTYDQVLGDVKGGNGDPNLCLFGEDVTPNAHKLAHEFVLLDNFYVNAEVSADGHAFSMGAYANDFIEKTWPMNYADRGADYLTDGIGPQRNPYGNIAAPPQGYIWDSAQRAGITVRSYGEFGHRGDIGGQDSEKGPVQAYVLGLKDRINPDYAPWNLKIPDNRRVDVWLAEFHKFEQDRNLPALSIIYLPNDHTAGTRPGYPTPRTMVAENDVALGRVVEAISASQYWKESAIFVLEDDAQDGPDHVDAHRSVGLIISPYVRRGSIDSTLYTTVGFLRTMELILGLEPLTQYDASATPAYASFTASPNLAPFERVAAKISLEEKNARNAYGASESMAMDLTEPDRIPMRELNEILWKSVKGAAAIMPPPVRAAFLRPIEVADEDEDD